MTATQLQALFAIVFLGCLIAFSVITWVGMAENNDAETVERVEVELEKVLAQSTITPLAKAPEPHEEAHVKNVINAVKTTLPDQTRLEPSGLVDAPYVLVLPGSERKAFFSISAGGDVELKGLTGHWTRFRLLNGEISKN